MTRINFDGTEPVYVQIEFYSNRGNLVYGLNIFPGEQSIEDTAWDALNGHGHGRQLIDAGNVTLIEDTIQEPAPIAGTVVDSSAVEELVVPPQEPVVPVEESEPVVVPEQEATETTQDTEPAQDSESIAEAVQEPTPEPIQEAVPVSDPLPPENGLDPLPGLEPN